MLGGLVNDVLFDKHDFIYSQQASFQYGFHLG